MVATESYVGSSVLRKEDAKLLTGQGTFVDNQTMAGMAWMAAGPPAVRARPDRPDRHVGRRVDARRDRACSPRRTWRTRSPPACRWSGRSPRTSRCRRTGRSRRTRSDSAGTPWRSSSPRPASRREDAAEAVIVEATELAVVLDLEEAAKDEVVIHEDLGTNKVVHWSHGGAGDQSIFESAPVIVQERYTQPRLIPNAIEPRGCLAYGIPAAGEFTLVSATQIPHICRVGLSDRYRHPAVEAPDHRAGCRRRLRLEAGRVRGGSARAGAHAQPRSARSSGSRAVRRTTWRRSTDGA